MVPFHLHPQIRGLKESCQTAPHRITNAGSGKKLVSFRIIGTTKRHGPYSGPFTGDLKGYREDYFNTHRSGKSFKYIFDHKHYANGHKYDITLGFTEEVEKLCKEGSRVFSIEVNGETFAKDLDVYKESGGCKKVLILSKQFIPKNGQFEISFHSKNSDQHAMVSIVEVKAVENQECPADAKKASKEGKSDATSKEGKSDAKESDTKGKSDAKESDTKGKSDAKGGKM